MWLNSFRPPRLKPVGEPDEGILAEDFEQRLNNRMRDSDHARRALGGQRVTFRWKDYAHGGKQRPGRADALEEENEQLQAESIPGELL